MTYLKLEKSPPKFLKYESSVGTGRRGLYLCRCGIEYITLVRKVLNGNSSSCGCYRKENLALIKTTHGESGTKLYKVWFEMKERCKNQDNPSYKDYGRRGIYVCSEWENSFSTFTFDMGPRLPGYSLERINNNKGYSPDNCRWATSTEQANNKRNNVLIQWAFQTKTLREWSVELGISYNVLRDRWRRGWSPDKMFTEPLRYAIFEKEVA